VQITVEYDSAEVDLFIEVADAIEDRFPSLMVEGEEMEGGSAGAFLFEVRDGDGRELFSARKQGHLPDCQEILDILAGAGVSDS
jgi:selT/selW/selH-like putative selenoprotein